MFLVTFPHFFYENHMYYTWKESSGRALLRGVLENCETQSIILLELKTL
jgi:hypothetical protein